MEPTIFEIKPIEWEQGKTIDKRDKWSFEHPFGWYTIVHTRSRIRAPYKVFWVYGPYEDDYQSFASLEAAKAFVWGHWTGLLKQTLNPWAYDLFGVRALTTPEES